MFRRMRTALTESFAGAILVAWVMSDGVVRLLEGLSMPLLNWVSQQQGGAASAAQQPLLLRLTLYQALEGLGDAAVLLVVGYLLLRWLYYPPKEPQAGERTMAEIS